MSNAFVVTRPRMPDAVAASELVVGIYFDTVPASTRAISGSGPYTLTGQHGITEDCVLVCRLNDAGTDWEIETLDDDSQRIVDGANFSKSRLRASVTASVDMIGYIANYTKIVEGEDNEDREVFVPINWDMRSLYGFSKAIGGGLPSQVPYHLDDDDEFQLSSRECETPEP